MDLGGVIYVCNHSDFIKELNKESMLTQNVLDGLTDDSLEQLVYPEGRTLGRIAWAFSNKYSRILS